ncbi:hypothetical protein IV203_008632 [Nitzschia inconspicua]|uniref:Uncharacterized protein n=1 Tax=Nitzschia inconspicua TaxID=303405 RepID=A0A9K3KZX4_9STRA|nr:hypothetical protein IV203_008632 [Nitzschia inconspicua]
MTVPKRGYKSTLPEPEWQPLEIANRTLEVTTQCVRIRTSNQLLTKSQLMDTSRMKFFDKGFVNTLENNTRSRGAMYRLINYSARPEVQVNVKDIIQSLSVQKWQSETHGQHWNPTKGKVQNMKRTTNGIMGRTVTPASCCLLTVLYVRFLLNLLAFSVLTKYILVRRMTCSTHDMSSLLWFRWYRPVYYRMSELTFTLNFEETLGRFIRFAEHVENPKTSTVKLFLDDIWTVNYGSEVQSALGKKCGILRVNSIKTDYSKGERNKRSQGNSNLHYDRTNGGSITGILHFINQRPITWFSKNQNCKKCNQASHE